MTNNDSTCEALLTCKTRMVRKLPTTVVRRDFSDTRQQRVEFGVGIRTSNTC